MLCAALLPATPPAAAQTVAQPPNGWQACVALTQDNAARLACFDRWSSLGAAVPAQPKAPVEPVVAAPELAKPAQPPTPSQVASKAEAPVFVNLTLEEGCRNLQFSDLSRFWELEPGSDCGTFGIRGFRPLSLSVTRASSTNPLPSSPSAANTAVTPVEFSRSETRVQLSVRTKIAKDILTGGSTQGKDSLWFAYSQQSYWQLFNKGLSRPFRSTDHEPELIYAYPTDVDLPGGWRVRYTGAGLVHQSNGQSLPLSRSWNRAYLMAGAENGSKWRLQGRIWKRIPDRKDNDDNPDISDFIGRAELTGYWTPNRENMVGLTLRSNLREQMRGSARAEWLRTLGNGKSNKDLSGLRLHLQLFSGYGDTLIDYNRRRTVFSVGLSLVDW